ncbi:MAG: 2-amino-4-hydroxy-6-hydroxymethyldihydropteridine diphosphokinase [Lactobacillales bacterium]|jgi:2-amino-4-hydroxy-6-hydroxymethyldihydropteridine diphosphokinase|nr:2-amino-4-hydroxy-6-hydroxymethyldihydropteridine diphosphokinase [Lactobacillales bacterium]
MQRLAILSLGSSVEPRREYLENAVTALRLDPDMTLFGYSHIYETTPVGGVAQNLFYNQCVSVLTELEPHELLHRLQKIELDNGRTRDTHWADRTLDIDILIYEGHEINDAELTIPHPEMLKRKFVLAPLADMMTPEYRIKGEPVGELLAKITSCEEVSAL